MEALDALRARRSLRRYTGDPVPRAALEQMVDAARLAATGSNRQPWDFVAVTEPAALAQLCVNAWMEAAGAIIAVVMNPASRWWVEDGSAAIENLLVACTALGYGACWVEGDALPREAAFKALLGIPPDRRLLALIPVGVPVPGAAPAPGKKPLDQVLHWERF